MEASCELCREQEPTVFRRREAGLPPAIRHGSAEGFRAAALSVGSLLDDEAAEWLDRADEWHERYAHDHGHEPTLNWYDVFRAEIERRTSLE
jgi:hypothetical protein